MFQKKINKDFVNKLVKQKEGQTLDFKLQITSKEKIAKTIAGMANSDGGLIVIGLSDQGKIIGIDPEEEQFMVETANEEFCLPKVTLHLEEVKLVDDDPDRKEKSILIVEVSKMKDTIVFTRNQSGVLKAFKRKNDKTLSIWT